MASGYFVHHVDLAEWLAAAQKSIFVKNKVRKDLWQELVSLIHWDPNTISDRSEFVRIPHTLFVAMQSFCLLDGKGDTVTNDQLLNFCTTLDQLRTRLPVRDYTMRRESTLSSPPHREETKSQIYQRDSRLVSTPALNTSVEQSSSARVTEPVLQTTVGQISDVEEEES